MFIYKLYELPKKFIVKTFKYGPAKTIQNTKEYISDRVNAYFYSGEKYDFATKKIDFLKDIKGKNQEERVHNALESFDGIYDNNYGIDGQYICLQGKNADFSNQTTVIVAHWDPENIIDTYVMILCRHFKSVGYKVILASSNTLQENTHTEHWQEWTDAIIYRTCDGYDFTSWKAALDCFPSLYNCKELVFTNDSYFGPVGSFKSVHDTMHSLECDFWGLTYNEEFTPHIQSFYLVFRNQVLQHKAFKKFIQAIPLSKKRELALKFELTLPLYLQTHGFQAAAYAAPEGWKCKAYNPTYHHTGTLVEFGVPLFKRDKIFSGGGYFYLLDLNELYPDKELLQAVHAYTIRIGLLPNTASFFSTRIAYSVGDIKVKYRQYKNFPQNVLTAYDTIHLPAVTQAQTQMTDNVALALHCFYPDTLHKLLPYLQNMPTYCHLYVTTDTEAKKQEILQLLQELTFVHKEVRICPNKGWDMAAFFVGLGDILTKYEYILKLHVKKSTHMDVRGSAAWRYVLYNSLLGTQQRVEEILQYFLHNPQVGIIAPPNYPPWALPIQGPNHKLLNEVLEKKGLEIPEDAAIDFPIGGMFWMRSAALKPWLDLNLSFDDFETPDTGVRDGTLAHVLERLIYFGCGMENLTWGKVDVVGTMDEFLEEIETTYATFKEEKAAELSEKNIATK